MTSDKRWVVVILVFLCLGLLGTWIFLKNPFTKSVSNFPPLQLFQRIKVTAQAGKETKGGQ